MEINQRTDFLLILANILLVLSALPTLMLALDTKGPGPEGPVGFHMVTAPLALLQVAALAIAIHRGVFDFTPLGRPLMYLMLLPYLIGLTALPVFGIDRSINGVLAKIGMVLAVAACFAAVNRFPGLILSGLVLSLGSFGGVAIVGSLLKEEMENSVRAAKAESERLDKFQVEQAAFDEREFAKLPAEPGLWQLIQFTHSFNPEVSKQCLEKIAARPTLESDMIELLGTGWAEHSLRYLRDYYPLPHAKLAPAFGQFLDKDRDKWTPQLRNNPNAGGWAVNLYGHFEVAEKIVKDGGDLRAPLQRWSQLFANTKGMSEMKYRVDAMLKAAK